MKSVSDIAQNKKKAEQAQAKESIEKRELNRKKIVPMSALIAANLVFLSLDARGIDAVYIITNSWFLAGVTVAVSGFAALYWWDILYPHARRHKNKAQEKISLWGAGIGLSVAGVLAFLDYIVVPGASNSSWLWAMIVFLTIVQGIMLARFWQIDGSIEAEAKREESMAARIDLQDTAADFKAEIESMESLLLKLEEIQAKFPGKGKAEAAARAMGYPVLAEMLSDDDKDGIPNYKDNDYKRNQNSGQQPRPQQNQPVRQFAETVELVDTPKGQAGSQSDKTPRQ